MEQGKPCRNQIAQWGLGVALLLLVVGLCVNPCMANDLFWQLRMGQEIRLTHHLPYADAYSWTRQGHACVMHEWLAFVLFSKAYEAAGGFAGVWLLQTALVGLTFALLYGFALRATGNAPLTAFGLSVLAILASSPFFQPRPHLFTYLFLTLTVGMLCGARRQPERGQKLWLLVPLTALWANLHAGALLGVIVQGLFAAGSGMEVYLRRESGNASEQAKSEQAEEERAEQWRAVRRGALITFACAFATLLNPYGAKIYVNLFATLSSGTAMNAVTEWFSPDFHQPSGKLFELLAALVLAGLACSRLRRDAGGLLATFFLLHAALAAFRNVPLFALAGVLVSAPHVQSALTRLLPEGESRDPSLFGGRPDARLVPVLIALFGLLAGARIWRGSQPNAAANNNLPVGNRYIKYRMKRPAANRPADERSADVSRPKCVRRMETLARNCFQLDAFPEQACRFMEAARFPADIRLFNDYNYGGYLIWRMPQFKVFADGRADIYFGNVLDDVVKIHAMKPDWRQTLARYGANVALAAASSPEAHLLRSAPEWKLVYAKRNGAMDAGEEETGALLFVRDTASTHALIARCHQLCHLTPDGSSIALNPRNYSVSQQCAW